MMLCLILVACKKTTTTPNPKSSTTDNIPLLKTITSYYEGKEEVQTCYHNASGRIIKIVDNDSSYTLIEYSSSYNIGRNFNKNDSLVSTQKNYLNSKGYVEFSETTLNGKTDVDTNYYDVNGYMLDFMDQQITVENGNVTKRIGKNDTTYYYFDLSKSNTIGMVNILGFNLLGKDNTNLVTSEKQCHYYKPQYLDVIKTVTETKYTYEFDAKNRVIKQVGSTFVNGTKNGEDEILKFTYTE